MTHQRMARASYPMLEIAYAVLAQATPRQAPGNPATMKWLPAEVTLSLTWSMDKSALPPPAATSDEPVRPRVQLVDEAELVRGCQAGDRAAMHTFYVRYQRRVFVLIARILGAQEAEELTQDVFLRAFRAIGKFRGDAQLSTWMYRLAVNAALSHASRAGARAKRSVSDDELAALPAPSTGEVDPRLRLQLSEAMARLPPGYRAVLVLHDIEGLQHDEIAEILGCRIGTSKSQLHKARAHMRRLLAEVGVR
jgi:RNA polymerase sigma-70 factor (ECF subfamily)